MRDSHRSLLGGINVLPALLLALQPPFPILRRVDLLAVCKAGIMRGCVLGLYVGKRGQSMVGGHLAGRSKCSRRKLKERRRKTGRVSKMAEDERARPPDHAATPKPNWGSRRQVGKPWGVLTEALTPSPRPIRFWRSVSHRLPAPGRLRISAIEIMILPVVPMFFLLLA